MTYEQGAFYYMQTESFEEKRRYKRIAIDGEAECEIFSVEPQTLRMRSRKDKMQVKVNNLSLGGLQIITDTQIHNEQILRMKIRFQAVDSFIWGYSQVRWCTYDDTSGKYRVGLQF